MTELNSSYLPLSLRFARRLAVCSVGLTLACAPGQPHEPVLKARVPETSVALPERTQDALRRVEQAALRLAQAQQELDASMPSIADDKQRVRREATQDVPRLHPSLLMQAYRTWRHVDGRANDTPAKAAIDQMHRVIGAMQILDTQLNELAHALSPLEWQQDEGARANLTLRAVMSTLTTVHVEQDKLAREIDRAHQENDGRLLALLNGRDHPNAVARVRLAFQARELARCVERPPTPPPLGQTRGDDDHDEDDDDDNDEAPPDCRALLQAMNAALALAQQTTPTQGPMAQRFWQAAQLRAARTLLDQATVVVPRVAGGRAKARELRLLHRQYHLFLEESVNYFGQPDLIAQL